MATISMVKSVKTLMASGALVKSIKTALIDIMIVVPAGRRERRVASQREPRITGQRVPQATGRCPQSWLAGAGVGIVLTAW